MTVFQRVLLVVLLFALDVLIFFLPIMAIFAAYVILRRPEWFRKWVQEKLYA